jgi:hypothetical protein
LKASFTIAPFLIHLDPSKPLVLETNAFDFAIVVMFTQLGEDNFFHPVNFRSHKFSPAEINYEIHDKKI